MKKTCLIATAVISIALTAPVTAHHMSPMDVETLASENFDLMGMHELAYDSLDPSGNTERMSDTEPADSTSTQTGSEDMEMFPYMSSPPTQTQDGTATSSGRQ